MATVDSKIFDTLPIRVRRTLLEYCVEHRSPTQIADQFDITVSAVYERLKVAERILGVRIARQSHRGRKPAHAA